MNRRDILRELQDPSEAVKDCAESVKEDNPELDKSSAFAICQSMENKGELADGEALTVELQSDKCGENEVLVNGDCVSVENTGELEPPGLSMSDGRVLASRKLRGPIERETREDGTVVYRNLKVLTEGIWTDANSQEPIHYIPGNLDLADDNTVNLIHDTDNEVSEVGHMENESTEDGEKYVDVVLHMDNPASEYADENLQKSLETNGEKGFGGPSVEIPAEGQKIEPDGPEGVPAIADGKIDGLGLVGNQADKNVSFAKQTQNRSVALADGEESKVYLPQNRVMDERELQEIENWPQELYDFVAAHRADMDAADVADALGDDGEFADFDPREWATLGADAYDTDTGTMLEHAEMAGGEDRENETHDGMGEDEEEDEEDTEMMDNDGAVDLLEEEIDELWDKVREIEDQMAGEEMAADLEDAQSELSEAVKTIKTLESENEELERRLSELEEEPQDPKTLGESKGEEWDPNYDDVDSPTTGW